MRGIYAYIYIYILYIYILKSFLGHHWNNCFSGVLKMTSNDTQPRRPLFQDIYIYIYIFICCEGNRVNSARRKL